ncbi:MAG: DegT/DnrJ/EryC1/StrS family aminotransferase [bacterium]|nr:DegT/DnrJ/EryC1/StrS family aminotransferase [bacterium]
MANIATPIQRPAADPAVHRKVNVGELVLGPTEREYLQQVIDSGSLSYGPFTRRFEAEFARRHRVARACFCSSGTAALQLALAALMEQRNWKPGDEVIVPSVTFVATVNVVLMAGLKPVLVDVRPDTYTIDPEQIAAAITPRTRCLMPVHLLGLPADMRPIMDLARRHGLAVVEDSCETMFAEYAGQPVGSFGDVACFSTYVAHFLVTGVGGLATTNDPELAALIRSLMNHGRDGIYLSIDDDDETDDPRFHEIVDRRFRFQRVGYSSRCTEMEAAIGLAQLERCDSIIAARKQNADVFNRGLADLSDVLQLPTVPNDRDHAYMVYGLVVRGDGMKPLVHYLEDRGIETRDMLPLIHQPVYRNLLGPDAAARYPVAHHLWDRAFYLGCHQYLGPAERAHVVNAIHDFFGRPVTGDDTPDGTAP